jgi:hypothetical protein
MDPCRSITELVSAGLDRDLGATERLRVRLHLLFCKHCSPVERPLGAIGTFVRRLAEQDRDPPP